MIKAKHNRTGEISYFDDLDWFDRKIALCRMYKVDSINAVKNEWRELK